MKKNKRQRLRLKPLAVTEKQAASAQPESSGLKPLGWFGGAALLLLIAYFVFQKPSKPAVSASDGAARTNRAAAVQSANSSAETAPAPDMTNRPGAVKNLETEGSADDMNNAAVQLIDKGDPGRAISIFHRAIAIKPDDETFHFNLALAYMKSGDPTNAEREYKESLRLLPDYPEANNNYGNLLTRSGRTSEAEQHLSEAVNEMPQSANYNNSLGVVQQKLRKTNEAFLSFQKAVECDTNLLEAHFNLAQAYLARQNRDKGIVELLEALRIKPDFVPAKRALAGLTAVP